MASGGALIASDNGTGAVIGSSRFHGFDEAADEIEIGWTSPAAIGAGSSTAR